MTKGKGPYAIAILPLSIIACQNTQQPAPESPPPQSSPVREVPDDTYISLSGTIAQTRDDAFLLDYGSGVITVEMDDYDFYPEGKNLLENDEVIVYGFVDDDFRESRTIEAKSVYVENLGTQFFASGADEEDFPFSPVADFSPRIHLTGEVISTSGRKFDLATPAGLIEVDTTSMPYHPLDDEGYQKVEPGDRVRVTGSLEKKLFEGLALDAQIIINLDSSG